MPLQLYIDAALAGRTLAAAVRTLSPESSWQQVRQLIAKRRVRVNASVCLDDTRRLSAGERVEMLEQSAPPAPPAASLHLYHTDEHLVVVEKPAGVLSERRVEERNWDEHRKALQPTLDELLRQLLTGRHGGVRRLAAEAAVYPVHRLDRQTSGVMIYALSPQSQALLIRALSRHEVEREYVAFVQGHLREPLTARSWLVRDRGDGIRGSGLASAPGAREAITHFAPVETIGDCTQVRCRLETGRTHQIRIHLSEAGYPLCGETVYTHQPGEEPRPDNSGAPRIALHSTSLRFTHPMTQQALRFASPLAADLKRWWRGAR
jgi:23S rRNA pseudouridine1911/1915/1917 synthase